jgi:predicted RNA methylase
MSKTETREEVVARRGYSPDIRGDLFGLEISNYAITAEYLAKRLKGKGETALELCCGLGVTLKELANVFDIVTGIELDKQRIAACEANTANLTNVKLIQGDVSDTILLKQQRADVVIYDVPYWDTKYLAERGLLGKNPDIRLLLNTIAQNISRNIVVFAQPGTSISWLSEIKGTLGKTEKQKVYINDFYDRDIIYFGNLVQAEGETEIHLAGGKTTPT